MTTYANSPNLQDSVQLDLANWGRYFRDDKRDPLPVVPQEWQQQYRPDRVADSEDLYRPVIDIDAADRVERIMCGFRRHCPRSAETIRQVYIEGRKRHKDVQLAAEARYWAFSVQHRTVICGRSKRGRG